MAWQQYRSHKIVRATPIRAIDTEDGRPVLFVDGELDPFDPTVPAMAEKASLGDYAVIYEDGYCSVSPRAAFETGYTRLENARIATVVIPEGYTTAKEFADDCGFELVT